MKNFSLKRFGVFVVALAAMIFVAGCKTDDEPEHVHTFSQDWSSNATHHWHAATCGHTTEEGEKAEHTEDSGTITTPATTTTTGVKTYKCTVCKKELRTEEIAKLHTYSDEWTSDKTHHWHVATCEHTDEVSVKEQHTFGDWSSPDASGTKTKKCTVCDYAITAHEHVFSADWTNDETHHWHAATCGDTSEVKDNAIHTPGEWTIESFGETRKCTTCERILFFKPMLEYWGDFSSAIKKTGATYGTNSNVEKIIFGLLSDNEVVNAISNDTVKATKQDIGIKKDTYYAYYDEANKTIYIVPVNEDATEFILFDCGSMFSDFQKVKEIKGINLFDTSKVTNMKYMFSGCQALSSLDVSNFDTSKVTNMQNMFSKCNALTSLDVSNFDTSKVTNMSNMFSKCNALTSLDVSNFKTSEVTNMSEMFSYCEAITSLDVSNFDTSKVTNMSNMFYYCKALTSLDVSNFKTSEVTNMRCMFSNCNVLTSLDVSRFNTSKVTDMSSMFTFCNALTSLDVSRFDTAKVTNMSSMFYYCKALTMLDVSNFDTSKVTDMSKMFSYCEALTSLDVSNFGTSKVIDMSDMFSNCKVLISLDLSKFDTAKVTNMTNMFSMCNALTSLDVSSFDTSKVTKMRSMFSLCRALTSLDVRNFDTSKVTDMSWMFRYCSKLTQIIVADKTKFVPEGCNVDNMFDSCGVTDVDGLTDVSEL